MSKGEIEGQRRRIAHQLVQLRAMVDTVELNVDPTMGVDMEAAQNLAYASVRLVSEVARLFQLTRPSEAAPPNWPPPAPPRPSVPAIPRRPGKRGV